MIKLVQSFLGWTLSFSLVMAPLNPVLAYDPPFKEECTDKGSSLKKPGKLLRLEDYLEGLAKLVETHKVSPLEFAEELRKLHHKLPKEGKKIVKSVNGMFHQQLQSFPSDFIETHFMRDVDNVLKSQNGRFLKARDGDLLRKDLNYYREVLKPVDYLICLKALQGQLSSLREKGRLHPSFQKSKIEKTIKGRILKLTSTLKEEDIRKSIAEHIDRLSKRTQPKENSTNTSATKDFLKTGAVLAAATLIGEVFPTAAGIQADNINQSMYYEWNRVTYDSWLYPSIQITEGCDNGCTATFDFSQALYNETCSNQSSLPGIFISTGDVGYDKSCDILLDHGEKKQIVIAKNWRTFNQLFGGEVKFVPTRANFAENFTAPLTICDRLNPDDCVSGAINLVCRNNTYVMPTSTPPASSNGDSAAIIGGSVVGGISLIVCAGFFVCCCWDSIKAKGEDLKLTYVAWKHRREEARQALLRDKEPENQRKTYGTPSKEKNSMELQVTQDKSV
ncbi:MAG: hypothetical protein HYX35_03685 [Proteobacteria bacterium]|nr:hypothetical protein [Pseudomonadota bacterium]